LSTQGAFPRAQGRRPCGAAENVVSMTPEPRCISGTNVALSYPQERHLSWKADECIGSLEAKAALETRSFGASNRPASGRRLGSLPFPSRTRHQRRASLCPVYNRRRRPSPARGGAQEPGAVALPPRDGMVLVFFPIEVAVPLGGAPRDPQGLRNRTDAPPLELDAPGGPWYR